MTIASATRTVRMRQSQADSSTSALASETDTKDAILGKLTAFVPTDIITAWAAALGVISPTTDGSRWIVFVTAALVLVVVVLLDFALKDKKAKKEDPKTRNTSGERKAKTIVVMGAAFTTWSLASPGSPLGTVGMRWAFGAAIILSIVLYRVAELWDIAPKD